MSWQPCPEPEARKEKGAVEFVIRARPRDLGGFSVRRVLPSAKRRMVGPFIFFDHIGPADFPPGQGINVRPHPHIGLATVTYLFTGEILHRDSLGYVQPIQPGAVNLMAAGRGIVHSERTPPEVVKAGGGLHGIQLWLALPDAVEEMAPAFLHYPAAAIPQTERGGVGIRTVMGKVFGLASPVRVFAETFYAQLRFEAPGKIALPADAGECAVYIAQGAVTLGGGEYGEGTMLVLHKGAPATLEAKGKARVMVLGGKGFQTSRHIWWNFVSSSKERIERAKTDWKAGRFAPVPGDDEFIPLPEE